MIPVRGMVVSVGYDDLLSVTLPTNMMHMHTCVVITSLDDDRTASVAGSVPDVEVIRTDAFTRHGAKFNKGLAIEETLDRIGRDGWFLIWDADTVFPAVVPWHLVRPGFLYGSRRKILADPREYAGPESWKHAIPMEDDPNIGFFQLFHGSDPAIVRKRPWYEVTYAHAGGCDDYFRTHWPPARRLTLPIQCVHLGPVATNWYGRASARLDGTTPDGADENLRQMNALIKRYDWNWARYNLDMKAIEDDGTTPHRVEVPGYDPTGHEVPFARRRGRRR